MEKIEIPVRLAWALVSQNVGIRQTAQMELEKLLQCRKSPSGT